MNCPNCLAELPTKERALFFACPKCNFLLLGNGNKIRQVDESDIVEKYQQISKFQRWICSTIRRHEWSGEGYITTVYKGGCIKSRVCSRCFVSDRKIEKHEFLQKYLHEDSCEVQYICKKCGVQDSAKWTSGKSHSFSEWIVDTKNKFPRRETRKCKRCGLQDHRVIGEDAWRPD
jgi:hypothetical protein